MTFILGGGIYVRDSKTCRTAVLVIFSPISTDDLRVPQTLVRFKEANKLSIIPVGATRNN